MQNTEIQQQLQQLNPQQKQAVESDAQYLAVLAGAGSGKTKVLTLRMAWQIANGLSDSSSMLAMTFTNKAGKEMKQRLASDLEPAARVYRNWHLP